ncbi:Carboxymuconolactone decarboxylase family protein [Sulfidibacter corallicola]|uniref:Carboxymuconolactone decarboxylase family protein n=1 Tax=Sulfidibacter corallicola TaxID=2818388 RepID=A0A8A4TJZ7_SULCO|nr:carboxymuconolactone decarboxylase family protein [Sulfidibacter corallicola]QTD49524.1 carboxymuconolactone decarboxylase family protein [Sulfidibacter corallicola]
MSRFELVRDPSGDPHLEDLYDDMVKTGFGKEFPINWFTSQALRPDILEATWFLTKRILVEGLLPASLKQMIATTISVHNHCRYCTVTHTGALEALGISKEVIESCILDKDLSGVPIQYRDILKFAVKAAKDPNSIQDEDYRKLKENGLNHKEILELVMMSAFINFINTWADASGIEID